MLLLWCSCCCCLVVVLVVVVFFCFFVGGCTFASVGSLFRLFLSVAVMPWLSAFVGCHVWLLFAVVVSWLLVDWLLLLLSMVVDGSQLVVFCLLLVVSWCVSCVLLLVVLLSVVFCSLSFCCLLFLVSLVVYCCFLSVVLVVLLSIVVFGRFRLFFCLLHCCLLVEKAHACRTGEKT